MNLAMIGLGKKGPNMVLRLLPGGHPVVAIDRDAAQVDRARVGVNPDRGHPMYALGTDVDDALARSLAR